MISALSDDTPVYVDGHGPSTLGEIRGCDLASEEDATVRMNVLRALYDRKGSPWRSGRIRVGSKDYPVSVCMSDRSLRLSTSSGQFEESDVKCLSAPTPAGQPSRNDG